MKCVIALGQFVNLTMGRAACGKKLYRLYWACYTAITRQILEPFAMLHSIYLQLLLGYTRTSADSPFVLMPLRGPPHSKISTLISALRRGHEATAVMSPLVASSHSVSHSRPKIVGVLLNRNRYEHYMWYFSSSTRNLSLTNG